MKSPKLFNKFTFESLVTLMLIFVFLDGNAQEYRNARAYINDFGKNELFVKESLMEYSSAGRACK
jgi:hypothetical protein